MTRDYQTPQISHPFLLFQVFYHVQVLSQIYFKCSDLPLFLFRDKFSDAILLKNTFRSFSSHDQCVTCRELKARRDRKMFFLQFSRVGSSEGAIVYKLLETLWKRWKTHFPFLTQDFFFLVKTRGSRSILCDIKGYMSTLWQCVLTFSAFVPSTCNVLLIP